MNKQRLFLTSVSIVSSIFLFSVLQQSCNPTCQPLVGLEVVPAVGTAGTEVIIKASPLESLLDQELTISFNSKPVTKQKFYPNVGLIVTVPEGVEGPADLLISNPDCEERLNFNAVASSFFEKIRVLYHRAYRKYSFRLPHCHHFHHLWKMHGCIRLIQIIVFGLNF